MIAQLLDRAFVMEQMRALRDALAAPEAPRRGAEETVLPPADRESALGELSTALAAEERASTGQEGYDLPAAERRGEESAPLDAVAFFSRDPVVSIVQSALEEYFEERRPGDIATAAAAEPGRRGEEAERPAVTDRYLLGAEPGADETGRRIGEKFSITDPGWVNSKIAEGIRLLRGTHAFRDRPATTVPLGRRARLVLVGDWGSGIPRAVAVAAEMTKAMAEGRADGRDTHVIHLGDVYYSGWKKEVQKRFLAHWPVPHDDAPTVGSWSLNANHDMFSGGHGYFDCLLADPRFQRQEGSSFFHLQSDDWDILGLDTGYEDHALKDPQASWAAGIAGASARRLMLLSHHQLFSAYEGGGPKLEAKLRPLLAAGRVDAWFWGHEHRAITYRPHGGVRYARCIGHGGVPVYMPRTATDPVKAPGAHEFRDAFTRGLERWALFGFAVVDLDGPSAHVRYVDENGRVQREEDLG